MIRPHLRNKKKELEFMRSGDISRCPCCGNWNMWLDLDDDGCVTTIICTKCGWVCGDAKFRETITLRYEEIMIKKEENQMSYRKVGYIEQIYYIFKYWLRERIKHMKREAKRGRKDV